MAVKLPIAYEEICNSTDGCHDPSSPIIHTGGEYDYYAPSGNTVVFFKPLDDGKYHVVICEIDAWDLMNRGIKYEDFIKNKFTF